MNFEGIKIKTFSSDQKYWVRKDKEIRPKFEAFINGGQYEIVKITTVHSKNGDLIRAVVYYRRK